MTPTGEENETYRISGRDRKINEDRTNRKMQIVLMMDKLKMYQEEVAASF